MIDNIPISEAKEIFERELEKTGLPEIAKIKEKVKENHDYQPVDEELEILKSWARNPDVYLDEGQLQKIYDFKQGSIWDFILHALNIRHVPTPKERIERGFESYLNTYPLTDDQIKVLGKFKKYFVANVEKREPVEVEKIFDNPVRVRLFGGDYEELNKRFEGRLKTIVEDLQSTFRL